jgi:RNase P subunit RPR2
MDVMMELKLTLGFVCCGCEECVTVTVECRGEIVSDHDLPGVKVPCPTCGTINQLSFETNGTVRSVRPCVCYRPLPQPSLN